MSGLLAGSGLEGGVLTRRMQWILAGLAIGLLLLALTLGFLTFAAYLALLERLAPWQAALAVAGGALLIAAILLLSAARSLRKTAIRVQTAVKTNAVAAVAPTALRFASRNAGLSVKLAALAGALFALWRAVRPTTKPASDGQG
jgi:hypothetical protein